MIVYGIKNIELNKIVYVGLTIQPMNYRWKQHLRDSRTFAYPLCRAIRKYGKDNFEVVELGKANSREELNELEREMITKYNTMTPAGYNIMFGQSGGEHSEETKEKIRIASVRNGFGKWKRSEQHNLSNKKRAIEQHSDPIKRMNFLIANGSREFYVFELKLIQRHNNKRPAIYEKGKSIGTWLSASDCAKDLGLNEQNITQVLRKEKKSHKGLLFEYKEN